MQINLDVINAYTFSGKYIASSPRKLLKEQNTIKQNAFQSCFYFKIFGRRKMYGCRKVSSKNNEE